MTHWRPEAATPRCSTSSPHVPPAATRAMHWPGFGELGWKQYRLTWHWSCAVHATPAAPSAGGAAHLPPLSQNLLLHSRAELQEAPLSNGLAHLPAMQTVVASQTPPLKQS